jgi:hypothetical protein
MLAPTCLFNGAINDALRSFSNLAWRDVEVVYYHTASR